MAQHHRSSPTEKPPGMPTMSSPRGRSASLCQTFVTLAPARSKATARSRSQFEPGKVMTAAFTGDPPGAGWDGGGLPQSARGGKRRIGALPQAPEYFGHEEASAGESGDHGDAGRGRPVEGGKLGRGGRKGHAPGDERAQVHSPGRDQREEARVAPGRHPARAVERELARV